jgi:uncharacterized protein (TIGR00251 family)
MRKWETRNPDCPLDIREGENFISFPVWIQPKASSEEIVGFVEGALKVRVTQPAIEGKANRALLELLAKKFGVAKSQVEIVAGETSRRKLVKIWGVDAKEAMVYFRNCWGIVQR